jgi:rhodanese-related sulfurtransferase
VANSNASFATNTPSSWKVLPQAEFEEEHLPGAINIPLKSLDAETARRLEREWPVIVYCHDYQ